MKKAIVLFFCLTLLFCSCSFSQENDEEESANSSSSLSTAQLSRSSESSRESSSKSESSSRFPSESNASHSQSSDNSSLESQSSESSSDKQNTIPSSESSASQNSQAQSSSGTLAQQPESSGDLTGGTAASDEGTQGALSGYGGIEFLSEDESAVLEKINQLRQNLGLSALTYDGSLQQAARIRSREMCVNNYFAHSRPDGSSWQTVVDQDVPIAYNIVGENLAAVNTNDPNAQSVSSSQWLEMWCNSPSHYATMTDGRYTHAGVGICYTIDSDGLFRIYATVLFCRY